MKMTRFEKCFVNRKKKSDKNIKQIESDLKLFDLENIKTVIELGCGVGFVSSHLAEAYGFTVYGTDYDPEQIQLAEDMQPNLKHLYFRYWNLLY